MKRINIFACMALGVMLAAGCDKDEPKAVDFPITGTFTITGQYANYPHQSWTKEDQIGVFVTSDGVEQANLLYVASEESKDEVMLNPSNTAAGFKQGEHGIYAYIPYTEGNTTYSAVKLPKIDIQEYVAGNTKTKDEYLFATAKLAEPISEYTSQPVSLGKFYNNIRNCTIGGSAVELSKSFIGKTLTKASLSATIDIAPVDATINLADGKISGKMSKTIELTLPAEGLILEIPEWAIGFIDTPEFPTLHFAVCIDGEVAKEADFTLTVTIDGKEYSATSKPNIDPFGLEGHMTFNTFSFE